MLINCDEKRTKMRINDINLNWKTKQNKNKINWLLKAIILVLVVGTRQWMTLSDSVHRIQADLAITHRIRVNLFYQPTCPPTSRRYSPWLIFTTLLLAFLTLIFSPYSLTFIVFMFPHTCPIHQNIFDEKNFRFRNSGKEVSPLPFRFSFQIILNICWSVSVHCPYLKSIGT